MYICIYDIHIYICVLYNPLLTVRKVFWELMFIHPALDWSSPTTSIAWLSHNQLPRNCRMASSTRKVTQVPSITIPNFTVAVWPCFADFFPWLRSLPTLPTPHAGLVGGMVAPAAPRLAFAGPAHATWFFVGDVRSSHDCHDSHVLSSYLSYLESISHAMQFHAIYDVLYHRWSSVKCSVIWGFPKIGGPPNHTFLMSRIFHSKS